MTRRIIEPVLTVLFLGLFIAALMSLPPHQHVIRPAFAQPTLLGPNVYGYAAVTTAQQIVPPNPSRHALQICNPGGTNILWIAPQGNAQNTGAPVVPAANGAGSVGVPVTSAGVVPCFAPPTSAPSIGQGWNGFSTTTPVTVYEWP